MTFAELSERAARAGNALLALGVQAEQRVLMVMLDTIDFVSTFLEPCRSERCPSR